MYSWYININITEIKEVIKAIKSESFFLLVNWTVMAKPRSTMEPSVRNLSQICWDGLRTGGGMVLLPQNFSIMDPSPSRPIAEVTQSKLVQKNTCSVLPIFVQLIPSSQCWYISLFHLFVLCFDATKVFSYKQNITMKMKIESFPAHPCFKKNL